MRAISVTDQSGKEFVFPSITAFRTAYQVNPPTIARAIKKGKITRGRFKGWIFKYLDTINKEA